MCHCDEGKPTCANCVRSKRVCDGYRPTVELIFRDNTESTRMRTQKRIIYNGISSKAVKATDAEKTQVPNVGKPKMPPPTRSCLNEPVDQRAVRCFFNDYAWARK